VAEQLLQPARRYTCAQRCQIAGLCNIGSDCHSGSSPATAGSSFVTFSTSLPVTTASSAA
jgi:hypothetical protein